MRKLLALLALLGLSPLALASSLDFTWTNTNASLPPCSASVTTLCLKGYTLTDVTNASSPVVVSASIAPSATSYSLTPLPSLYTVHTYQLVATAVDAGGNTVTSDPATVSTTALAFAIAPPGALSVTVDTSE